VVEPRSLWALILAGGDGKRLSALTATADGRCTPKQYCSLNGGPSLLALAVKRAARMVPMERIVVVVTENHRQWWEPQLSSLVPSNVIAQPSNRGTALGILLPLLVIAERDARAAVICLPSDHHVANEYALNESLRQAISLGAVDCGKLTLLGMVPGGRDAGYGYIVPGGVSESGLAAVHSFYEKPDPLDAARLLRNGAVWNSGIFTGLVRTVLDLYPRHAPGLLGNLKLRIKDWPSARTPSPDLTHFYETHPILDFSRDLLARQPGRLQYLAVPPCGWSDVGTPARVAATLLAMRSQRIPVTPSDSPDKTPDLATALAAATALGSVSARDLAPGLDDVPQ
jgi:mannose-1-phosphate guanylyltransferase